MRLDHDVHLSVLEKVPFNDPITWCFRTVVTPKLDGTPRRVIDYTLVNKHTLQKTHHTQSPWVIVSSIHPNKVKTAVDCWHGYHSVPLHLADHHITTFVTKLSRYRYKILP